MSKDPDRRYQAVLEVRNELEELKAELDSKSGSRPAVPTPAAASGPGWGRRAAWVGGTLVVAAIVWLLRGDLSGPPAPPPVPEVAEETKVERKTIVVFPFESLGPPEESYFAAGMTEEITTRLTRVGGLAERRERVERDAAARRAADPGRAAHARASSPWRCIRPPSTRSSRPLEWRTSP